MPIGELLLKKPRLLGDGDERPLTQNKPPDDLDNFGKRLQSAKDAEENRKVWKKDTDKPPQSALGLAFRVSVELVSALAVGLAIGWGLDELLGTRPWVMLVFLILGGAAGILNVYRMASGYGYAVGYQKRDETQKDADNAPHGSE